MSHHCVCSVAQRCPTICYPLEYSLPGASVHGILQAKILEWFVIPFSRGSSRPRGQTHVSCIGRWILYYWATREAHIIIIILPINGKYVFKSAYILFLWGLLPRFDSLGTEAIRKHSCGLSLGMLQNTSSGAILVPDTLTYIKNII